VLFVLQLIRDHQEIQEIISEEAPQVHQEVDQEPAHQVRQEATSEADQDPAEEQILQQVIQLHQVISVQVHPQEGLLPIQYLQEAVPEAAQLTIQILTIVHLPEIHLQAGLLTAADHQIMVHPVHTHPDRQVHQDHRQVAHHHHHHQVPQAVPHREEGRYY